MFRFFPLLLFPLVLLGADWSTYRGNAQRSGGDGKPGPTMPKVLWSHPAKEHFVAAPIVAEGRLYASGLGFVNAPTFYALDIAPMAKSRVAWLKTAPVLELPTVSSPALSGDTLIFGEGMHQTNGASVYGIARATGTPLWQFKVEGDLVHLEGAPTLAGGKVYLGGGAAGVLCLDPEKLTLEGKALAPEAIAKTIENKRAELQKKYEQAKAKNDPFAVPPTDRDLPRATPALVWQAGKERWHVDAPVAVIGDKVLVASAFLDKEKVGSRALYCLEASTGKEVWMAPLSINPWGGPSVQGDTVVVTGSSISYAPEEVKGAKGVIAAFDLATGKPRWKKDLPGAALACAALTKDLVVVPCTDGKVRAYSLAKGAIRWTADTGAPYFAPATLSDDTAYVADLEGIVYALNLKTGARKWKLDLGAETKTPGSVYAGPVLAEGRLYVATCNLAGKYAGKPTVIVCISD
jgi:outer membrane protein assembly factor BamB